MKKEMKKENKSYIKYSYRTGSAVYGLGFIGAAVYYISISTGFWMGVLGFLKAMIWPALLVYEILKHVAI